MSHCVPNWGAVESLATHKPPPGAAHTVGHNGVVDLVPWFDGRADGGKAVAAAALVRDAVVPCTVPGEDDVEGVGVQVAPDSEGGCTRVGSCSGPANWDFSKADDGDEGSVNASSFARVPVAEWSSEESVGASLDMSDTFGDDSSRRVPTMGSSERELSESWTTSFFSLENTFTSSKRSDTKSTTPSNNNNTSAFRIRKQRKETDTEEKSNKKGTSKSSNISTKRSRCNADQSQRKRREKINQRMKKLQSLVPTSKTKKDKEWVLDKVIEQVKQLQAQLHMMTTMMMPMPIMPYMPMGVGPMIMGMGPMVMGMGFQQNLALPYPSPAVYMPAPPWNVAAGQLATVNPQSHWPVTMEGTHSRMTYLMQQQHSFMFQ